MTAGNVTSATISGTAEANATLTRTVSDAGSAHTVTATGTANGSGAWSITNVDLSSLNDGTVTLDAAATDDAGNASPATTVTSSKDAHPPTVTQLAVGPSTTSTTGAIKQGGTYYVYANVATTSP